MSRRVSCAVRFLREFGVAQGPRADENKLRIFDADWDRGHVVFRKSSTDRPTRILTHSREADTIEVESGPEALAALYQELRDARLQEKPHEFNDPPRLQ